MTAHATARRAELAVVSVAITAMLLLAIVATDVLRFHVPGLLRGEESLDGHTGALLVLAGLEVIVLVRILRSLARQVRTAHRLRRLPRRGVARVAGRSVEVLAGRRPLAFCGGLLRPRIYVTEEVLEVLGPDELAAVVEHEAEHARRLDPLRLAVVRTLADGFGARGVAERHAAAADIAADAAAVAALGSIRPLATAMATLEEPAPERVDQLLGRPSAGVPAGLLLLAGATTLALAGVAALLATAVTDPALPAALLVLFAIPALLAALRAYVP